MQSFDSVTFKYYELLKESGTPWEWFLKPLGYVMTIFDNGVWGVYVAELNNPPILLLTLPALIFSIAKAASTKNVGLIIVVQIFMSSYLLLLLVKRPIFNYSSIPLLPFCYILIAYCIISVLKKLHNGILYSRIAFVLVFTWGMYLYPLATSKAVPVQLYKPILTTFKVFPLSYYLDR